MAACADRLPGVTDDQIHTVFEPFVVERFAPDDPRLADAERRLDAKYSRVSDREPRWTTTEGRRTTDLVRTGYEATWGRTSLQAELDSPKTAHFEWRGAGTRARTLGRKRVHQLLLTRAFEWLQPESVLEVGFGYGLNLLTLSMQFPSIRFSGVELTEAGVANARALAADAGTAQALAPFAVGDLRDLQAPSRLDLQQGGADALPLADKCVDVAITVLALEQMERIRDRALAELARVARRHVVMVEPFRDWNDDGHRRKYIERNDYFAARVDDLSRHGLTPLVATADMPNKVSFRAGIVVAAVEADR